MSRTPYDIANNRQAVERAQRIFSMLEGESPFDQHPWFERLRSVIHHLVAGIEGDNDALYEAYVELLELELEAREWEPTEE